MLMPLKLKLRTRNRGVKNGAYRSRTGPQCCSANCAKGGKFRSIWGRIEDAAAARKGKK